MKGFKHWAHLNEEGLKTWKGMFPNGIVPVLSMIPQNGHLGAPDSPPQPFYIVNLKELSEKQIEKILDILTERFQAPREEMRKEFMLNGIPLRQSLTSGSGTNQLGLFL